MNTMADPHFLPHFSKKTDADLIWNSAIIKQLSFGTKIGIIIEQKIYQIPITSTLSTINIDDVDVLIL